MNILVTGGVGFLGSNLCHALLRLNHKVICVDNEITGNINNIKSLFNNSNFIYIKNDIANITFNSNIDIIFNLACPTSPGFVKNNPLLVEKSCNNGLLNIINLAKLYSSKLIHISSVKVNEDSPGVNVYSDSKRISEQLIQELYNDYVIIRLGSTYGPNMLKTDSRVIPQFIYNSLIGNPLTLWGGNQLDTFMYVDDVINFFIYSLIYSNTITTIGSTESITIKQLANKIIKLSNSKSTINIIDNFMSTRTLNYLRCIDSNFKNTISLDNGLLITINYFKSLLV